MPFVLDEDQFEDWMRGAPDQAAEMMKPYAGKIELWEVSRDVGNVKNNLPELMGLPASRTTTCVSVVAADGLE